MSTHLHIRLHRGRRTEPLERPRLHPMGCACRRCDPRRAIEAMRALNHWAHLTLAGLALGLAMAWIVDRLIDGPGVLSIFGVSS
jgi:hypothetical protein